jgi:hypothetical protein
MRPMPMFATVRVRQAVAAAGGAVRFVRLEVSAAEQERRIALPSRKDHGKLSDLETLRQLRRSAVAVEQPPADVAIDTEQRSAEIVAEFGLQPQQPIPRYP